MRYVSPEGRLAGPEEAFESTLNRRELLWDSARSSLGGGRFWSVVLVLLLTLTVARSTSAVQWVNGIDVVILIAVLAAVVMGVLALSRVREWIGLGIGLVLAPGVALWGGVASDPSQPPERRHRPAACRCVVEPHHRWNRGAGTIVLPVSHLSLDVGYGRVACLVRAALGQTHAGVDPRRRRGRDQPPQRAAGPRPIHARDARAHSRPL